MTTEPESQSDGTRQKVRLTPGAIGWSVFQGGRDPYVILLTIYVFAPYFATVVVGDAIRGQALLASISTISGLIVAATAPVLGASIDQIGKRKPLLMIITWLMIPMIAALWFTKPVGGLGIPATAMLLGTISLLFAYGEMIHNSLLTTAASPREAPYASGLALSAGNFFSVFSLTFVLIAFVLPGKVDWGFVPAKPMFGLSTAQHEPDRIVALISAGLFMILSIPLMLFTPDAPASQTKLMDALKGGFNGLKDTIATLRGEKDVAVYLGSRMIFADGMTALLTFGGVYAAGVMHWGVLEMLVYGLLLSIFAVFGGFCGAWMDDLIGPKRSVQVSVGASILCLVGQLGMGRDKVLFFFPFDPAAHAPLWNGPMFRTLPEVLYLIIGFGTAIFVTAHYASSRTLLTRLAPPSKLASFFGLYALSGTATVWLGSMLVNLATRTFHTQQAGFAPIALLLVVGFIGMFFVKGGGVQR
jgi:UMF1 family MFS transporter